MKIQRTAAILLSLALVLAGCAGNGQAASDGGQTEKAGAARTRAAAEAPTEEEEAVLGLAAAENLPQAEEVTKELPQIEEEKDVFTSIHHRLMTTGQIFPDSSYVLLTNEDIQSLFTDEKESPDKLLRMAVNEIYARAGYTFRSLTWFNDFYSQFYWYEPTDITSAQIDEDLYENAVANIRLLTDTEKAHGFSWKPAPGEPLSDPSENQALTVASPVDPDTEVPQIYKAGRSRYSAFVSYEGNHVWCSYDVVGLTTDSARRYPALAEALTLKSREIEQNILRDYKELQESYDEYDDLADYYLFVECNAVVDRADKDAVTILYMYDIYSGGAHDMYYSFSHTFDTATGKELLLSDIVKDPDVLYGLAAQKLHSQAYGDYLLGEGSVEDLEAYIREGYPDPGQDLVWSLDPDGLTLYFAPYALASFAAGELKCTIWFSEEPDLFRDPYGREADSYIRELRSWQDYALDLKGNGKRSNMTVGPNTDEYGNITELTVKMDGGTHSMEMYGYDMVPYLVRADGRTLLWCVFTSDNDYQAILPAELTGGAVSFGDMEGAGLAWSREPYAGWNNRIMITDPHAFVLGDRGRILSTYTVSRIFKTGSGVAPEGAQDAWTCYSAPVLTAKKDVPASRLDPDSGQVLEEGMIPRGTKLTFVRTDQVRSVDLAAPDGTLYRVSLDTESYPQTIRGIEIEELFDGMQFAG